MNNDLRIARRRLGPPQKPSCELLSQPGVGGNRRRWQSWSECQTETKHEFLVVKTLLPEPGDLKIASSGEVVFGRFIYPRGRTWKCAKNGPGRHRDIPHASVRGYER